MGILPNLPISSYINCYSPDLVWIDSLVALVWSLLRMNPSKSPDSMWFKNHMKSEDAWCMHRNVHSYIMFTVHITYCEHFYACIPTTKHFWLLTTVCPEIIHASKVPSSGSLIVLPRWWKIRFRSTSGRSNAWSNDRNVQRSLRWKQLGCVSDYPVILRILGFFSSSFSGKIHHPRPRTPFNRFKGHLQYICLLSDGNTKPLAETWHLDWLIGSYHQVDNHTSIAPINWCGSNWYQQSWLVNLPSPPKGKPTVSKPLVRPYLWGRYLSGVGRLTSHSTKITTYWTTTEQ